MDVSFWTSARAAATLLLLGNGILFPGLMMFWNRHGERGGKPPSHAYFALERGLILGSIFPTAAGFLLLQAQFQDPVAVLLARAGAVAYLVGGLLGAFAEVLGIIGYHRYPYRLIVVYVIVAYLAQAVIGAALVLSGLVAPWVGWVAIIWNIAWLAVLSRVTSRDIYFPILHHIVPLILGIALLSR